MSNEKTFIFDSSEGQKDSKTNPNVVKVLGTVGVVTLAAAAGIGGVYAMSSGGTEVTHGEVVEDSTTPIEAGKTGKGIFEWGQEDDATSQFTTGGATVGANANPTGTTFNPFTAPHAHSVNDNMSFAQAFASARQETGAGGVFEWRGQVYGTFYATEVDKDMNPIVPYTKTDYNAGIWQGYGHGHGTGYEQHWGTQGKNDWFERQEGWLPVNGTVHEGQVEDGVAVVTPKEVHADIPAMSSGNDHAGDVDFLHTHDSAHQMDMAQATPEIHHDDLHDHDLSGAHDIHMGDHGGLMDHMDSMS